MLKTIIYRELLANIITYRFLLGLLICTGLVGANTYVLIHNYEDRLQNYQLAVQANTNELHNIQVYSELSFTHHPKVDRKPRLMSILNEGATGRLGTTVKVSHNWVPFYPEHHGSDNPYLVVFPTIDLTLVLGTIISLLAFLFAYDTIAGEREKGTLSLTLSNAVPRGTLLFGKYLSGMLNLAIPLALSLLVAWPIIFSSPSVEPSGTDFARIGLFFIVSLVYISVFFTLGMLFSSLTQRTATALMLAMFFWVVLVPVWPSASAFAVLKLKSIAGTGIELIPQDLWKPYQRELDNFLKRNNLTMSGPGFQVGGFSFHFGGTLIGKYDVPPEKLALIHEYQRLQEEARIRYMDKMWQRYLEFQAPVVRRDKLKENIARISPSAVYAQVTAILAETDMGSDRRFLDEVMQYRRELIQYLRDQNAFASETWYNPEAGKKINKEGIPLFRERPESLSSSIRRATFDILILVLLNVVFFLLTYLSFLRYDVR